MADRHGKMVILDFLSLILLTVLVFWTGYNGAIILAGARAKHKKVEPDRSNNVPNISIIVPCKNEEKVIRRCLDSFLKVDYPKEKMQIIVIDGNSKDSTPQICKEFCQKKPNLFTFLAEKNSRGKPAALNQALRRVTGEIVAVYDADSLVEKDSFRKAVACFKNPEIMAVQGRTISLNEKRNILTRIIAMEEKAWFQALLSGREKLELFVPLNGSCQFVRQEVLKELGGWDENSLTEDVELALRLVERKHVIKYAPDICSGQETPNGLRELFHQRIRWYRGYMETALKYGSLLNNLNKKTVDAEISLAGPFMMVVSLLSYINWFFIMLVVSESNPILNVTGLVIALTAISLLSVGFAVTATDKPLKPKNILWIPSIYLYWLVQMVFAGWAFLRLVFRRKREWSKTDKKGFLSPNQSRMEKKF